MRTALAPRARRAGWILLPLLSIAGTLGLSPALDHLRTARARGATLERIVADGPPASTQLMAAGELIEASSHADAEAKLTATLRDIAVRHGVLIEQLAPAADRRPPVAAVRVAVSGDAAHVLRFVEAVESRAPAIRFYRWRLARAGDTATTFRLEGEAASAWDAGR